MELKDFITETLVQMMEGVKNAQVRAEEFGAIVNPDTHSSERDCISAGNHIYSRLQPVEFEIALTEISTSESQKGIGVSFAGIGAKGEKGKNEQNSYSNKIKFSIPIVLPFVDHLQPYKKK